MEFIYACLTILLYFGLLAIGVFMTVIIVCSAFSSEEQAKYNLSREGLKTRAKRTALFVLIGGFLEISLNSIRNWWND